MITKDIKAVIHSRWMRCINEDNLDDYVDISIGSGSGAGDRLAVLEIVDFIGGDWRGSVLEKGLRRHYDYYYLYYRDRDGIFDPTGNGEYINGISIGQHRDGNIVKVDILTNEIIEQISINEWK